MHRKSVIRLFAILSAITIAAVGGVASAYAGVISSPSLTGAEIAATATQGKFVGTAVDQTGGLSGTWKAVVDHSTLTPCAGINQRCAWVTGGTFKLYTSINRRLATVSGTFNGATRSSAANAITPIQLSEPCGKEKFLVTDTLSNLGINGSGQGTGTFTVLLTHYRFVLFGHCVTYAATVVGHASLSLP